MHAVFPTFDTTDPALLLQWTAVAHCVHVGYVMNPASQALQVAPVNPTEQVHVHAVLPTFDVTEDARPLQWVAVVHWAHAGYVM